MQPAPPPSRAVTHIAIVVAAVGLVMLLAVAVLSVALFTSGTTAPLAPRPAPGGGPAAPAGPANDRQHRWLSRFQPAFTRGTGQWVNVSGIVDRGIDELTMFDGATGKMVWHVPAPIDSDVYADGEDRILAYDTAKRVMRYDAKTGKVRWTITVADFVHDITFGNGCASLRFGEPLGIDTETGSLKSCTPTRPALARIDREALHDVSMKRGDVDLVGAIQLDNRPINADPPRFLVKASRAGRELWRAVPPNLEPIWTSDGFHRSIALTPSGVFVFGRNPGDHHARWLLLDASTGNTVLSSGNDVKVDDDMWLASGGSQVFVVHNHSLEVFASTGKLAWRVADN
ncbi:MAG TPA: PQQ-binding-like beta-propeller repeat protein [Polyangiaceae bacterium]|nr:PQQ-binding-like beta-propeller repeat protein [Polyangiaceae bacterium]